MVQTKNPIYNWIVVKTILAHKMCDVDLAELKHKNKAKISLFQKSIRWVE